MFLGQQDFDFHFQYSIYSSSKIHFLREQFWNAFFETKAILGYFFEMHFLREQFLIMLYVVHLFVIKLLLVILDNG